MKHDRCLLIHGNTSAQGITKRRRQIEIQEKTQMKTKRNTTGMVIIWVENDDTKFPTRKVTIGIRLRMTVRMICIPEVRNEEESPVPRDNNVGIGIVRIRIHQNVFMQGIVGSNRIVGLIIRMDYVNLDRSVVVRIVGFHIGIRNFIIEKQNTITGIKEKNKSKK
jgi:hypothetical protein